MVSSLIEVADNNGDLVIFLYWIIAEPRRFPLKWNNRLFLLSWEKKCWHLDLDEVVLIGNETQKKSD